MQGTIYIISNESMPGLLKIGITTRTVEERMRELNTTGVPTKFISEAEYNSNNIKAHEARIHAKLNKYRINQNREFFEADLFYAKSVVREVTESDAILLTSFDTELQAAVHAYFAYFAYFPVLGVFGGCIFAAFCFFCLALAVAQLVM